jgi:hypothetical protein
VSVQTVQNEVVCQISNEGIRQSVQTVLTVPMEQLCQIL